MFFISNFIKKNNLFLLFLFYTNLASPLVNSSEVSSNSVKSWLPPEFFCMFFGYDLFFLMYPESQIAKETSFAMKAMVIMLQQSMSHFTNIKPIYIKMSEAISSYLSNFLKSKLIFNKKFISKIYSPEFSFNIVGYDTVVSSLNNIIVNFKEGFIHPGHVLLYGPPGTGKTKMITDLLIKNKLNFVVIDMKLLQNNPIENLPIIFDNCANEKTVFLIDEFDGFLPPFKLKRALSSEEEKQLSFWKTIFDSNDPKAKNRLIFCTTNHKDYLDEGILRPGRLENHFEVANPIPEDRLKIFFSKCKEYEVLLIEGLTDQEIIKQFQNCSGAQIDKAVRLLAMVQKSLSGRSLTREHFIKIIF